MEEQKFKDVVVVGNGPSAITLSFMLAGNWPYYNGMPHPIDFLQTRLEQNKEKSIIEQDLLFLSNGLEGRSSNPLSVLFDTLVHPQADLGIYNPPVVSWKHELEHEVDHVVLGQGAPGGCWQKMDGSTLTISLGSWMELPDLSIREWDANRSKNRAGQSGLRQKRATVQTVAEYYEHYVKHQGLSQYFVNNAYVTSISKLENSISSDSKNLWEVRGYVQKNTKYDLIENESFCYVTPHVVLATGNSDVPNMLNIEGENLPFVCYSLSQLENHIKNKELSPDSSKLLIVGGGLSAADAVIAARFHNIPIVHVFRRSVNDPELIFNKLPQNIYPEYHKVHQMMQDANHYDYYKALPSSTLHEIQPNGTVLIKSCLDETVSSVKVTHVVVLIGMHPNLSFLPDKCMNLGIKPDKPVNCKSNPVDIHLKSHESLHYPGIFAVGPLVGDNFVRFVQGGCLAVASEIWHSSLNKSV